MSGFRSTDPYGKTADFVNAVHAKLGADFVKSWLSSRSCRFSDDTIFTIGLAKAKLEQTCEHILRPTNDKEAPPIIRIVVCPDVTAAFYQFVDAMPKPEEPVVRKKKRAAA